MNIRLLRFIENVEKAQGIAVIIDVFRAGSFECYAIQNNVERIIPVASKELAYDMKQRNPTYILAGERKGIQLPGFDYGNSPSQIEHVDLTGRTIIHTTSAGTQGFEKAVNADEILVGSLVNAKATAQYILKKNANMVSLVCMGNEGLWRAEEDELCAEYIKSLMEGLELDISDQIKTLRTRGGQRFFDSTKQAAFPERDFHLCTSLNCFDFALRFRFDEIGLGLIEKVF